MKSLFLPCSREVHGALDEDGTREEDIPAGGQLSTTEIIKKDIIIKVQHE